MKAFVVGISIICNYTYAKSVDIEIRFEKSGKAITGGINEDNNNYVLTAAIPTYSMPCSGKDSGYSVSKITFESGDDLPADKKLLISVEGPYETDKRDTCKTKDDHVYFTLNDLKVDFVYKGRDYSCLIDQNIGTSFDSGGRDNDKLQGDIKDKEISCGANSPFNYVLHPGHTNPGYISIHKNPDTAYNTFNDDSSLINIFSNESDIKNYYFSKASMRCAGRNGAYSISNFLNQEGALQVQGTFDKDPRETCKIPADNVYFIVESSAITFDYKGTSQQCGLSAVFGTSYDHLHVTHNKLQSYIPDNPFGGENVKSSPTECIGAPGFFYRIIQGSTSAPTYSPGYIEIYHGDFERPSKSPISWNLYINGMMNGIDDAMASSLAMSDIGDTSPNNTVYYGFLYNQTHGFVKDGLDLYHMKTFDNIIASDEYVAVYEKIYGPCPTTDKTLNQQCHDDALEWYLTTAYTESGAEQLGVDADSMFGKSFDTVWQDFISFGIESTDKILFVGHSQGNLYANTLINYLSTQKHYSLDNLNTLHIGVTSTILSTRVDQLFRKIFPENIPLYVTNTEDHIINDWRNFVIIWQGVAPVKGNIGYQDEPRIDPSLDDAFNHELIDAYLNHESTRAAISNLYASYMTYNEIVLSATRPAKYSGIYVYAISKNLQTAPGYLGFQFDSSYATTDSHPNFKVYKDSLEHPLNLESDVATVLEHPSNNIKGFELKSAGRYIFDFSDNNIRYIISSTAENQYCGTSPYIMILSANAGQKVICKNTNAEVGLHVTSKNSASVDLQ